jgi:hypothetical protein
MIATHVLVIPAQAGIQQHLSSKWIPGLRDASLGMTTSGCHVQLSHYPLIIGGSSKAEVDFSSVRS